MLLLNIGKYKLKYQIQNINSGNVFKNFSQPIELIINVRWQCKGDFYTIHNAEEDF